MHKLAKLYISMGQIEKAATCFIENLKRKDSDSIGNVETVEAIMFLAKYYKSKYLIDKTQL